MGACMGVCVVARECVRACARARASSTLSSSIINIIIRSLPPVNFFHLDILEGDLDAVIFRSGEDVLAVGFRRVVLRVRGGEELPGLGHPVAVEVVRTLGPPSLVAAIDFEPS